MPKNEHTLSYFKRYSRFYLQGDETCWRVEATDWISTPGVLQVTAVEYYANEHEDDIENGIAGGLIIQPIDPNEGTDDELQIIGETFIYPHKTYEYSFDGSLAEVWKVDPRYPVELTYDVTDPRKITVKWLKPTSG
jgi:hypothetical protein